jgi:dTDP-glucose pyrophosphorylase
VNFCEVEKAVVLAGGLGTRMRAGDEMAALSPEQAAVANSGLKAMMPVAGHRFLDHVLTALADAGIRQVCLVVGPEHQMLREYYTTQLRPRRLSIDYAVQPEPRGTAAAVVAAEAFVGRERFLMINSDNYYPVNVCTAVRQLSWPGLAVFERESLVRESNISAERVWKYAVTRTSPDGYLERIIEKPDDATIQALGTPIYVNMNIWQFSALIFRACRSIPLSPRGEFELTDAVQYAVDFLGERFQVLKAACGVLDLSHRTDIATVTNRLRGMEVKL